MDTQETQIEIGILQTKRLHFHLNGVYLNTRSGQRFQGAYQAYKEGKQLILHQEDTITVIPEGFTLTPLHHGLSCFELTDVTIGIHFHWERKETQQFRGALKIISEDTQLTGINIIPLEEYLLSVISSEMNADSPMELLKAHAVISRSWLLAQKAKTRQPKKSLGPIHTRNQYIHWYDREDHDHFDVCADDHCQRYQGISKVTPAVQEAVKATWGEVLTYNGEICDARFSKCCGGVSEQFENVWSFTPHPYLTKVIDSKRPLPTPDLSTEEGARQWINSTPDVFCNVRDKALLGKVLNQYDQETDSFFRWQVSYTAEELSKLVSQKLNRDLGYIREIIPLQRGASGRLVKVKIIGSLHSITIGKELVIRKAFSPTHLYSSAFIIEKKVDQRNRPTHFTFKGAGWGHGVGLCQIGAAAMSEQGYSYRNILAHYFPGTRVESMKRIL